MKYRIREPVVHLGEPCGAVVAQIGGLDRCWFSGKECQPVAGSVARQVHQNVDFVALDLGDAVLIALPPQIAPLLRLFLEPCGVVVVLLAAGIEGDLHLPAIPLLQQRFHEVAHRVAAEIW
jgi:hypothetical protein